MLVNLLTNAVKQVQVVNVNCRKLIVAPPRQNKIGARDEIGVHVSSLG
jgi:hypothetical protein